MCADAVLLSDLIQVDNYNKKIIFASVALKDGDEDYENTEYTLQINYFALGFTTLILNFAFPLTLFIALFFVIGIVTVLVGVMVWVVMRLTTLLQTPPELKVLGKFSKFFQVTRM